MGVFEPVRKSCRYLRIIQFMIVAVTLLVFSLAAAREGAEPRASPSQKGGGATNEKGLKFVPGELLVKFREGVTESKKERLHQEKGTKKIRDFKPLRVHRLKLKEGISVEAARAQYLADPDVEYAEPNYRVSVQQSPNDPRYPEQWALFNRNYGDNGKDISAPAAWDITTGNRDIVVAVIDTGIDYNHEDLAPNIWVNSGEIPGNGVDDDGNGYVDDVHGINAITGSGNPMDDHRHGTHVAGIIGAVGNNGIGVSGVNWSVSLIGCKFLDATGTGSIADAIECLQYLKGLKERETNPVDILATNNSWGSAGNSMALKDAIASMGDTLFVAGAGNDSQNNDSAPFYPASYSLPNVISVAATDRLDELASFSNFGKRNVDVAAPGDYIMSTVPGNFIGAESGTSMAAPHVTGLAALIVSLGKDWKQARNLILTGGDPVASLDDRVLTGRRISAYGSLTCTDSPLLKVLDFPAVISPGVAVTLSVLSVNCDVPSGPVSVSVPEGTVALHDDGSAPDVFADDGIFTGTWVPSSSETEILTFSSPSGILNVASPPLALTEAVTFDSPADLVGERTLATISGFPYRQSFTAEGGLGPYAWDIPEGSLPSELNLSGPTGEISGTPTTAGKFPFAIRVTDNLGTSDVNDWRLIVNEGLRSGWPKVLEKRTGTGFLFRSSSPLFADLNGDGKDELIVADVNTLYLFNEVGLIAKTVLPGAVTAPAIADLDGDGEKEIIVNTGFPAALSPSIYAFHKDLTPVVGFPAGKITTDNGGCGVAGTPVVADLDSDGNTTILAVCVPNKSTDPNFGKNVLIVVNAQGEMVDGWPKSIGTSGLSDDRMVAVADLDGDGRREIVLSSTDGTIHILRKDGSEIVQWSAAQNPGRVWNPVPADLNGDGLLEIAVKTDAIGWLEGSDIVGVFDRTGSPLPGWPRNFTSNKSIGLIAADIDSNGLPELVFPTKIYGGIVWQALRLDGSSTPGWPLTTLPGNIQVFPVVGDANGDGLQEVFFGHHDAYGDREDSLSAYKSSGEVLPGYPKYIYPEAELRTTPALGDLDGNGRIDIAVKAEDGLLYVFEAPQGATTTRLEWPMYGHDPQHTNAKPLTSPQDLSDLQVAAVSGIVSAGNLTYSVTVENGGALPAAASTTGLYLSSSTDYLVASISTERIDAGTEKVLTGTVAVPSTIPPGTYSVVAVADTDNAVFEGEESNNRAQGTQVTLENDLSVVGFSAQLRKGLLSYTLTVKNTGTGNPASSVALSFTTDPASPVGEYLITQLDAGKIAGGSEKVLTGTVAVPATVTSGTYYLAAFADPDYAVIETNEMNNGAVAGEFRVRNSGEKKTRQKQQKQQKQ